jgi:hypothetical protein
MCAISIYHFMRTPHKKGLIKVIKWCIMLRFILCAFCDDKNRVKRNMVISKWGFKS